jgi:predicted small lipoprotein YifL
MQNKAMMILKIIYIIGFFALAGCGVKGDPSHPENSEYPRTYPQYD